MKELKAVERIAKRNADNFEILSQVRTKDILAIAEAFRSLEQRAEAAESKLAELEKREPIGMVVGKLGAGLRVQCYFMPGTINLGDELFTSPAPAINLAELEKQEPYGFAHNYLSPPDNDHESIGVFKRENRHYGRPLFTRPAPAVSLAELVPDEMVVEPFSRPVDAQKALESRAEGFNLCRAAMLEKLEKVK